ncbi:hypothetical protein JCM6882_009055 [Rhodosporidiobolus microsporus]
MAGSPSLAQLVAAYNALQDADTPTSPLPAQIASTINDGTYRLVLLVKELGEALTSENDATRARGVGLLSAVVTKVDKSTLDRQSTKTLTTFFTDKLSEKPCLVAAAQALTALVEKGAGATFGVGEGMEVARGILSSITLKSHPQPVRHQIYLLLDRLVALSRASLIRMGSEFVGGYAELVEGEKDPRNLMISFGIVRVMLLEFEVAEKVEDLFDITFCYFPITFTPPPDDPYGISSEDLIVALRACLSATPLFGRLALPLFFDKLQAASEKAKRQTLQALEACFPIYGAEASGEWAGRFSEALTIEVFHASDTAMQDLSLSTFRSLFSTLYPDVLPSTTASAGEDAEMPSAAEQDAQAQAQKGDKEENNIEGVAIQVVENALDELKEPEKNNAKPAVRILTALIASSARLAHYVLSVALPPLLSIYKNPDDMSLRPAVLTHLCTLLASLSPSSSTSSPSSSETSTPTSPTPAPALPLFAPPPALSHAGGASPLEEYRDDLLTILTASTRTLSTRLGALEGLVNLVRLPEFLSRAEVEFCIASMNDVLSSTAPAPSPSTSSAAAAAASSPSGADDEAYSLALSSLASLSALPSCAPSIESSTLPLLFAALPASTISPVPGGAESQAYRRALESLAELCAAQGSAVEGAGGGGAVFATTARRLTGRLEEVLAASFGEGEEEEKYDAATLYAHHLLSTLRAVLSVKVKRKDADVESLVDEFVPAVVAMVVLPTTREGEDGSRCIGEDKRIVVDVGKVVGLVLQRVGVGRQTTFWQAVDEAFHHGRLAPLLGEKAVGEAGGVDFKPFEAISPLPQRNLLSLYTSLLLPLSPSVPLPSSTSSVALLRLFLFLSLSAPNELQLQSCAWGAASLVNKRLEEVGAQGEREVEEFVTREVGKVFWEEEVAKEGKEEERRKRALRMWIWISKSLILRSSPLGYTFVTQLLTLFPDAVLGRAAAEGLGVIAGEGDGVLVKEKGAVIRLLYKQRFFAFLLPHLIAGYKDTCGHADAQAVYLVALSSLLQHIPKQLTLSELPKLLPLLVTSLDLPDPLLRANVIDALTVLVKEVPTEVERQIVGMVGKVLKGLTGEKGEKGKGAAQLRLSSLTFLGTLPAHIPYMTLHSQKATILKELGKAIDDPRRDVRRAAVDCRGRWFLYSGSS